MSQEARDVEDAVDNLVFESREGDGDRVHAAWDRIHLAGSPTELRVLVDHLYDERPTLIMEAMANAGGTPVRYTIGDSLLNHLRMRFVVWRRNKLDKWRQIDASPHLRNRETITDWFKEHHYDLKALEADHDRVAQDANSQD